MRKTERLQARLTPEIMDVLKELARKDRRTISAEIEILILEEHLRRKKKNEASGDAIFI